MEQAKAKQLDEAKKKSEAEKKKSEAEEEQSEAGEKQSEAAGEDMCMKDADEMTKRLEKVQ